jgi:D-3-phosphoglycerate dehydrogenase / 2-oxoglutarate reductase
MHKLLFCRPLDPEAMALVEARPDVSITLLVPDARATPVIEELAREIPDAVGVMLDLEPLGEALLARAPKLRVISRFGVGYDAVDVPACTRHGVVVSLAAGANDLAVAEHTMMLMLAVARRAVEYDHSVRAGGWMVQTGRRMHELAGKKVLVIGYGRIGTRVARLCNAFGMTCMVTDPAFPTPRLAADGHIPAPDLWAAIPEADIVTLHCPLNDVTRGMVNAEFLARMKPEAWLINTARGPIVDEPALAAALAGGAIAAAGVDVLTDEPTEAANPLCRLPNIVLSPHNAALAEETVAKMSRRAVLNLLDFIDGRLDPGYTVNPEVLTRAAQ